MNMYPEYNYYVYYILYGYVYYLYYIFLMWQIISENSSDVFFQLSLVKLTINKNTFHTL